MPNVNKIQQTKKALIVAMEKSLGVVTNACKIVGVDRTTFYNYYNSDPEFKKACDDCENIAIDFAESKLKQLINEGDTVATIFYLKTKGKHRGYIQTIENINKNTEYKIVTNLDE